MTAGAIDERARDRRHGRSGGLRAGGRGADRSRLMDAVDDRGEAHWATTGGSTPARDLSQPRRCRRSATDRHGTHVQLWWSDERFVPPDHPLSNAKIAFDDLIEIGALSGESGTGAYGTDVGGRRTAGAPIPRRKRPPDSDRPGDRRRRRARSGRAQRYAEMLRDGRTAERRRLAGLRPDPARHRAGRPHPVGLPGSAAFDRRRHWPSASRRRPTSSRTSPGSRSTRAVLGVRAEIMVVATAREGRDPARGPRPGARRAALAGPARAPSRRDLDPRRGGGSRDQSVTAADDQRPDEIPIRRAGRPTPGPSPTSTWRRSRDVRLPARPHRRRGPRLDRATWSSTAGDLGRRGRTGGSSAMMVARRRRDRPALRRAGTGIGAGSGGRLVELAKERRPDGLELYTFQVNERARRFYERNGFVAEWFGDGSRQRGAPAGRPLRLAPVTRRPVGRVGDRRDGTPIAVFSSGDRTAARPRPRRDGRSHDVASRRPAARSRRIRLHAIDRRGRGASGDGAARTRSSASSRTWPQSPRRSRPRPATPVDVVGHSYGGRCALGAALLTATIRRLVVYEGAPRRPRAAATRPRTRPSRRARIAGARRGGRSRRRARDVHARDRRDAAPRISRRSGPNPIWPLRAAAVGTTIARARGRGDAGRLARRARRGPPARPPAPRRRQRAGRSATRPRPRRAARRTAGSSSIDGARHAAHHTHPRRSSWPRSRRSSPSRDMAD